MNGVVMTILGEAPPAPRQAASVVLLRDGTAGLEVLLMRRHERSAVMGGVYVFPGGKLDAADAAPGWAPVLDHAPPALDQRLGEPGVPDAQAQGLFVAALRETLEEAGVLLATRAGGSAASPHDVQALQAALSEGQAWTEALAGLGLRANTQALCPWTRWITPVQPVVGRQRFDTWFFLAALPPGQRAEADGHEATEACWLTPLAALERYRDGHIDLVAPQLMGLAQLNRYGHVAEALSAALRRPPPCILPEAWPEGAGRVMCYPGDPQHPVVERAMDGPLRLRFAGGRFEPFNGFQGWFE